MSQAPDRERRGIRKWVNANTIGLAVLVAVICGSVVRVLNVHKELFDPDKTTIRISHWQLEMGYRDALNAIIAEYEKLHPDVKVIQMPVTEKVYGQWLNTHLVSGDPPDLAEIGFAKMATDAQYLSRFFMPLTELIDNPNPYNKGTPIEDLPWRETFIDGMRGGYVELLQDYFSAPTTLCTYRLFYNKDLLREATGSDRPPGTLDELFAACEAIRRFAKQKDNRKMVPIASSRYIVGIFTGRYAVPFTAGFEEQLDADLDGKVSPSESYTGFLRGEVDMRTPAIKASYECQKTLCSYFPPGFLSLGREEPAFLFVQGNAGMIATGSFDAMSLFKQSKFDVGVIDFPMPDKAGRWGKFTAGRANEAGTAGGGSFGVYKYSKHRDQAIDFLQFLTSVKYNQMFNLRVDWIPIIVGAKPSERMKPFMPDPRGFGSGVSFAYGAYASAIISGQWERFIQGELDDYEVLASKTEEALCNPQAGGDKAWAMEYDTQKRWCRNQERVLAVQSARSLMNPKARDAPGKYRQALLQQVRYNNGEEIRHRFEQVRKKPIPEI